MNRKCTKCHVEKDLEEFYNKKNGYMDKHSICKECTKKYMAEIKQTWSSVKRDHRRDVDRIRKTVLRIQGWDESKMLHVVLTPKDYDLYKKYVEEFMTKKADLFLQWALEKGCIQMPKKCEVCKEASPKLYCKQTNYMKPLDIIWLCNGCEKKSKQDKYSESEPSGEREVATKEDADL